MTATPPTSVAAIKIRFPAFRRFNEARIEANNAMVGMLVGARLSEHMLSANAGARVMLPEIYPQVRGVDLLNRTVADAQQQLRSSEAHLAAMALPFLQAVFEDFINDSTRYLVAKGMRKSSHEQSQGLEGTLAFVERSSALAFSIEHRELFDFLRRIRNQIVHAGGRADTRLDAAWAGLSPDAHKRWIDIAGRSYLVGGGATGRIEFEAPELTAALAITKRMALEVCGHLHVILSDRDWAAVVVDDHAENAGPLGRRSTLLREVRSLARREYGSAKPPDGVLRAELVARGLM